MLRTARHWRTPLAALLLGAATPLAFAPTGWWWLVPFTLAPLLWRALLRPCAPRLAARLGWLWGFGLFMAGTGWIQVSLSVYGELPWLLGWLAVALLAAFLALYPALAMWAAARGSGCAAVRLLLLAPAGWMLGEWVRGWVFTGFPWLSLGDSQAPDGWLAPLAPVLGHLGLSGLLVMAAGGLVLCTRGVCGSRRAMLAGLSALVLPLALARGVARIEWSVPVGEPVRVELLQPDIAQQVKWDPAHTRAVVEQVVRQVAASSAPWVVLPETAVPFFLQELPGDVLGALHGPVLERGATLLMGLPTLAGERYYNSVVALGGTTAIAYSKHHLVPFGEFVPPGFRWFVDAVSIPLADFSRGDVGQAPLALGGQRIAFMICYEDVFADEVAARAGDATLLVNQTNDAWFGQTAAPWQHAQQSQMRALENARPLLRATNNGVTLAADYRGRVIAALPPFAPGVLVAEVQGRTGTTPYQRWRDWPVVVVALLILLAAEVRRRMS
ncbi:MAG: apolipoprotein N-acyltransferase [Rhodocyclaceae bacterium]|nr:apolipoprotein N-acyltransferase [Rhodocyclaceae bacterium]